MPSIVNYQSGHLPSGVIPISRATPVKDDIKSMSDIDTSSDSENEAYGAQYSVETSPQDDKLVSFRLTSLFKVQLCLIFLPRHLRSFEST